MKIVGLTGGIATGKSTVAGILRELGAKIIDADQIARKIVEPGMPAYNDVVKRFGESILAADKTIVREKLGAIIFNDEPARKALNSMTHPRVMETMAAEMKALESAGAKIAILDIPLLYETRADSWIKTVVLVYCDPATQLKRLMLRDNCAEDRALSRIKSQTPIDEKKAKAQIVIDNSGPRENLEPLVRRAWQSLNSSDK